MFQWDVQPAESEHRPSYEELLARIERLERSLEAKDRRIAELEHLLEESRRGGKRQAGPFSKGAPKSKPKTPGRKSGERYGRQAIRPVPKKVDETVRVGCPLVCDDCGGTVTLEGKASQFQIDVPRVEPKVLRFDLDFGRCDDCGRRVQGRDSRQISDAVGVGSVQVGPNAIALAAVLNKCSGMSFGKISHLFREMFHLDVERSTIARALHRLANKATPTYEELKRQIRSSPVAYPDETGWRLDGRSAWLHGVTNLWTSVYLVATGRGFEQSAEILGESYGGQIVVDGWRPYEKFTKAGFQTCLTHLIRRSRELLETLSGKARRFPAEVKAILQAALRLRDRRDRREIAKRQFELRRECLERRLDRLLARSLRNRDNRRFRKHLRRLRQATFSFLYVPGIEATNWPSEHDMRAAIMTRKTCAGNRTQTGARDQSILMSAIRTCQHRGQSALDLLAAMLHDALPIPHLTLAPGDSF